MRQYKKVGGAEDTNADTYSKDTMTLNLENQIEALKIQPPSEFNAREIERLNAELEKLKSEPIVPVAVPDAASNTSSYPNLVVPEPEPIIPNSEPIIPNSEPIVPNSEPIIPNSEPIVPKPETIASEPETEITTTLNSKDSSKFNLSLTKKTVEKLISQISSQSVGYLDLLEVALKRVIRLSNDPEEKKQIQLSIETIYKLKQDLTSKLQNTLPGVEIKSYNKETTPEMFEMILLTLGLVGSASTLMGGKKTKKCKRYKNQRQRQTKRQF
jgi:hypothetical protein